ncbi:glycosyltransferase [Vicingaceae bacterium]|nr:glycosyltransferase [Vicingaceae bacterium]MDB4061950.1 glycosyltransferase [Vicingaceae bacterium]|tara:strand:- start:6870 stop:7640 length:771 start_codon:yes stop_codon:yes gene_type:complete
MNRETCKISIVTACFNSAKTIQSTINSILNQSVKPFEYIVVDGASSDETVTILTQNEQWFKDAGIQFKWISEKDKGIYDAWNKALKLIEGDWVAYLGSDDIYLDTALDNYTQRIYEFPEADFITAKAQLISEGKVVREFGEPFKWEIFKREMKILHAGGFLNMKYIEQWGNFDINYKITGDYELLLRKGKSLSVVFINEILVHMGAYGVSSTHITSAFKEARVARVTNKARNAVLAYFDYYLVLFKIKIKKLLVDE